VSRSRESPSVASARARRHTPVNETSIGGRLQGSSISWSANTDASVTPRAAERSFTMACRPPKPRRRSQPDVGVRAPGGDRRDPAITSPGAHMVCHRRGSGADTGTRFTRGSPSGPPMPVILPGWSYQAIPFEGQRKHAAREAGLLVAEQKTVAYAILIETRTCPGRQRKTTSRTPSPWRTRCLSGSACIPT